MELYGYEITPLENEIIEKKIGIGEEMIYFFVIPITVKPCDMGEININTTNM